MRKAFVLAVAAIAALAVGAPSASADVAIEVVKESNNAQHCNFKPANCTAHVVNDGLIELSHDFFGHIMDCNNEYHLNFTEHGAGTVSGFAFSPGDTSCSDYTSCTETWPFTSERVNGTAQLHIDMCFQHVLTNCEGEVQVNVNDQATEGAPASSDIVGSLCNVTGHWNVEGDPVDIL
jgi:hypothetical protein